jgi:hypothetical protein
MPLAVVAAAGRRHAAGPGSSGEPQTTNRRVFAFCLFCPPSGRRAAGPGHARWEKRALGANPPLNYLWRLPERKLPTNAFVRMRIINFTRRGAPGHGVLAVGAPLTWLRCQWRTGSANTREWAARARFQGRFRGKKTTYLPTYFFLSFF